MKTKNFAWGEKTPQPETLEKPEATPTKKRLSLEPLEQRDNPNVAWGE